jgi:hypothetical protein
MMCSSNRGGNVSKSIDYPQAAARPSESRAGYAEWLALGAVAAGSLGAIVGMANYRRGLTRSERAAADADADPSTVTAPHGDKLRGAVV